MTAYQGYLYRLLGRIGTRSEGPDYYLQQFDGAHLPVNKRAYPWADDPALARHLGTKVVIEGHYNDNSIDYVGIESGLPAVQGGGILPWAQAKGNWVAILDKQPPGRWTLRVSGDIGVLSPTDTGRLVPRAPQGSYERYLLLDLIPAELPADQPSDGEAPWIVTVSYEQQTEIDFEMVHIECNDSQGFPLFLPVDVVH